MITALLCYSLTLLISCDTNVQRDKEMALKNCSIYFPLYLFYLDPETTGTDDSIYLQEEGTQ